MGLTDPELLFQGKRFRVERVVQIGPEGAEHPKEIVRHPGAVTILPLLADGRICLVDNFRASVAQRLLELPAGTLEAGEDPAAAAHRELAEETGYRAGRLELLATFYTSPGILDEKMFLYLATALEPGPMALEAGEDIRVCLATREEALAMARQNRIRDAKTLVGLLYYETFRWPSPPAPLPRGEGRFIG
jgi:ADP-ribose pyrophosphatase